ncbi:MAG: hypothetical protein Q4A33_02925 [Candidatus Saccharibacteria bacterium]|nr:hypothetical protein [Candidatus Saccharibacteria bacterium]
MGYLEDMLVRNGVIYRAPDGSRSYIEGSLISNSLVVRNSSGWVTHRIERAANGVDLVVRNISTGYVEARISATSLF